eukprot:GDKI01043560.1.p1 GENE.GDKI01043560.1~~GDKI01043560.1.p1  ORF type:complete len:184 (+),score=67.81 GDKI01043560.1:134-685(+)
MSNLFKKFTNEEISSKNLMKSSAQRAVRAQVLEQFPRLESVIDLILPKKTQLVAAKCADHVTVVLVDDVPTFFQYRDGPWVPTLRLVHQYPSMLPKMQVDRGGIKFMIKGANCMCPGLTSAGGRMEEVPKGAVVQIVGEGKENACAVGVMIMSSEEIRKINKDVCIENMHSLGDGLWDMQKFD